MKRNKKGQFIKIPLENRFWGKVKKKKNGCWEWVGALNSDGYGVIDVNGKTKRVHRIIFLLVKGISLEPEQKVCHKCDNPVCVNPNHLFIGTQKDNMSDMLIKNRASNYFTKKGVEHPNSKFSSNDIKKIKQMSKTLSQQKIAEQFGVVQQTISRIITGKRYA